MPFKAAGKIAMIATILAVSACGTGPGTLESLWEDPEKNDVAFRDPSKTMPDYSVRGMSGVIALGFRMF